VLRTHESVILDDASTQDPFSADSYIRQRHARSVLCLPLMKQAKLVGILYLENNLASRVFTPARMSVLRLLSSQAAISLENARLYAELIHENRDRQRAEEALRGSEQRFRDYAETASDWLWETGPDHRFARLSDPIVLGIDPTSRIGVTRWDIATDVEEEPEKWRLHRAILEAHQPFRDFRYRTASADGSIAYIATSGKPVFDVDGRFLGYRGVSSDVTAAVRADQAEEELNRARVELAHVTRVTTLGELAASIAHEINQPLAAIGADADACLHWLAAADPDLDSVRGALTAIAQDSYRAGEVIARIRALLARRSVAYGPCDLAGVIGDVLPLVERELGRHGIVMQTSVVPDLPAVVGDRIQLQQVLLNLVLNAAEAMREVPPARRRMAVRATVYEGDDGLWAIVAVEDAGVGFGNAEASRLFEAFYTTKPGGLGMGLSISRSIIDSHRGRLWATANPDHGATFHIALPGMR
jgi:PAS domain S-box-containing protein